MSVVNTKNKNVTKIRPAIDIKPNVITKCYKIDYLFGKVRVREKAEKSTEKTVSDEEIL